MSKNFSALNNAHEHISSTNDNFSTKAEQDKLGASKLDPNERHELVERVEESLEHSTQNTVEARLMSTASIQGSLQQDSLNQDISQQILPENSATASSPTPNTTQNSATTLNTDNSNMPATFSVTNEQDYPVQSVCCLRLSALGDCINAFGVLGAMQQAYPKLKIVWAIDQRFAPLFCDEQGQDLIPMLRLDFKGRGLKAIFDVKRELLKLNQQTGFNIMRFDALLNMQTSIKSSLSSVFIHSKHKYGYDAERSRELQSFFVTQRIDPTENPHVLAGFMQFPRKLGLNITQPYWDFKLGEQLIAQAYQRFDDNTAKICAISPCSAKAAKNWTIDGYEGIIKHALHRKMKVVLLGGRSDLEIATCKELAERCPEVYNLCGQTNLRELAAVLKISSLVIAPDSGSMHLASALGTPVIGLFAIHNEQRVGPWNFMDLNLSVYSQLASNELKTTNIPWRYRVRDPNAMQHITLQMVIERFEEVEERYLK